jgi:hypothetical protein
MKYKKCTSKKCGKHVCYRKYISKGTYNEYTYETSSYVLDNMKCGSVEEKWKSISEEDFMLELL